ncbi:MAG: ABC transporter permease [Candidatus Thermoplasmatota archaeon]|nr:ABC transporter permease [Candidatus Thermoplasmatota archaeon]
MRYSEFFRGVITTAEKDIKIYYKKPPVIIFGLLFPFLMFLAFYIGRKVELSLFFPGFLAMTLFFTSSSVGPLVTPWERQAGTYERLLSYPVNIKAVLMGDILAGSVFGIAISSVVLVGSLFFINLQIVNIGMLLASILLGAVAFSSLGVLISAPATTSPSSIMMLSSLIRFPLIFISGIFIPLQQMESVMRYMSYFSPLTYLVDSFHSGIGGENVLPLGAGVLALLMFTGVFLLLAVQIHKRNMVKGL